MPTRDFLLPDLGEGLEDAEVVAWRVQQGDRVELNQTLVEVNTAKALVEIPAPWEGIVENLHAAEGDVIRVGQPLVSIAVDDGTPAAATAPTTAESAEAAGSQAAAGAAQQVAQEVGAPAAEQLAEEVEGQAPETGPRRRPVLVGYGVAEDEDAPPTSPRRTGGGGHGRASQAPVPASPPVRKLAKELGVDLAMVTATGPGGRVTREDVQKAAEQEKEPNGWEGEGSEGVKLWATEAGHSIEVVPVRGTRRLIAEKMVRSVSEIPHVTTFLTLDASSIQAFREDIATHTGERVSPLPILVRAFVEVCREFPELNSSFQAERSEIHLYRNYHVGIATETERGLLVPVVRDADRKGILEISREINRLSQAARAGNLTPEEMFGGTVTITNVGTFGSEFGTPIINHPEAAILALGVIEPRALVVDGRVEARPGVTMSLSFDHRVLDGARAGRALDALRMLLESPFRLGGLPR